MRYVNLHFQKLAIFIHDNLKYGYGAHVLHGSMTMHYGYLCAEKISSIHERRPCSSLGDCLTRRVTHKLKHNGI
jgi:hypothetical protein